MLAEELTVRENRRIKTALRMDDQLEGAGLTAFELAHSRAGTRTATPTTSEANQ